MPIHGRPYEKGNMYIHFAGGSNTRSMSFIKAAIDVGYSLVPGAAYAGDIGVQHVVCFLVACCSQAPGI